MGCKFSLSWIGFATLVPPVRHEDDGSPERVAQWKHSSSGDASDFRRGQLTSWTLSAADLQNDSHQRCRPNTPSPAAAFGSTSPSSAQTKVGDAAVSANVGLANAARISNAKEALQSVFHTGVK